MAAAAKPLPMRKVDEQVWFSQHFIEPEFYSHSSQKRTGRSAERRNTRSTTARARSERRRKRTRRRKRVKRRKTRDKSRVWGCPRELFNVSMLPQFGEHIIIKTCRKAITISEKKPKEDWEFACTGLDHIKDIIPFSAKHFSNKQNLVTDLRIGNRDSVLETPVSLISYFAWYSTKIRGLGNFIKQTCTIRSSA